VLAKSALQSGQMELFIHAAVSRDMLEPATASFAHRKIGLPDTTQIFDVSNACLGFLNSLTVAAGLIESGQIRCALVVSGESCRPLVEQTISTLLAKPLNRNEIKPYFANLTIGSGAVGAIVCHKSLVPGHAHRLLGGVARAATRHSELCKGDSQGTDSLAMQTDSEQLLEAGISLAQETWCDFSALHGAAFDRFVCHQVGSAHRRRLYETLGLDLALDFSTFETLGNTGSVALPATLARRKPRRPARNWQRTELPNACARMVTGPDIPDWLKREYPFAPQTFITPRGARMSYVDAGPSSDEAVLLLHGNPTWSYYFRHVVQSLAQSRRCIAPDHIGMGLSDKPQDYDYTLVARIADIGALVASLQLRRIHLVVHDWGGAIGFGLATQRPELVGRIVVLNTAAFRSMRIPASIALCRTKFPGTAIVRGLNGFARPATRMAMHQRALTAIEKRAYLLPYGSWADRVAVDAFVKDIPLNASHPSHATLAALEGRLPLLRDHEIKIVWGGADFCFNDQFYKRWIELFPCAERHYFAEAGHYVIEDAREEAVPLIRDFLTSVKRS
jgi:pimeloyl-ACP methyl ester carboxylesterase/3-oxoacyl-[acyl-carrier-protein] synthase III